jgi:hypothetical protein
MRFTASHQGHILDFHVENPRFPLHGHIEPRVIANAHFTRNPRRSIKYGVGLHSCGAGNQFIGNGGVDADPLPTDTNHFPGKGGPAAGFRAR